MQLDALIARAEAALARSLPSEDAEPVDLHRAMRYAVLAGGKRLRPLLVYGTAAALDNTDPELDPPACAVELIHAYSLIHDDLPSMDNDDLRRGQPTCHRRFGEAMAILAGDALQARAFELLAAHDGDPQPAVRLAMLQTLGVACGSTGMAGGQAIDLAATGRTLDLAALERMHARKTGALIRASVRIGALASGNASAGFLKPLDAYARSVGLAFQIRDDILDVEGETGTIGKTAGKDASQGKSTFPSVIGMQASHARLQECIERALAALAPLGDKAALLRQLAQFTATRSH